MNGAVATSLIGLVGSILVAAFAYWLTKRREREAEWRKEKLTYYKAFIESLSGAIEGDDTPEGHRLYAKATNNLLLFAPQSVIEAVDAYRAENAISNVGRTMEAHNRLLARMLLAIREDIGVHPTDNSSTFAPTLWASGVNSRAT
jgi:hypothetical protein